MRRLVAIVAILYLAACDGGGGAPVPAPGPTPTPGPQPVSVRVFSGWDDMPIAGAAIATPAGRLTTGPNGEISVSIRSGDAVDISAPGHRDFNAMYRGESPWNVYLWNTTEVPGEYIDALVYHQWSPGNRLSRPAAGNVGLTPSGEISADAHAIATLSACAGDSSTATGSRVTVALGGGGLQIPLQINPSLGSAGLTNYTFAGNTVAAAVLSFRLIVFVRGTTACHEIGHALGIGHSIDSNDVMSIARTHTRLTFSAKERYVLRMLFRRRPGTTAPDNDRDVSAPLSMVPSTAEIECPS